MSVYRFPPVANTDGLTVHEQLAKITEELQEVYAAHTAGDTEQLGIETCDVIQACETLLRLVFGDQDVERFRAEVIYKNARRGYYEAVD